MGSLQPFRESVSLRLVVLFTLFFFFLLIAGGIGASLGLIEGLSGRNVLLLSSVAQCLLAFCVPAWLTGRYSSNDAMSFLELTKNPGILPFIGVIIVFVLALPVMNQLISWNESVHFPEWASSFEHSLRELEDANKSVAETMMQMTTVWQFITTLAVVGFLTGFSEELFFRGAMQNIFLSGGMRKGLCVWGVAVIFSAMHFQFFGFVPRVLMGAFFGYLLLWTRSLWPAIFAHALNNSLVVAGCWVGKDPSDSVIDKIGLADNYSFPVMALASAIATALFLWQFRQLFFKNEGECVKTTK